MDIKFKHFFMILNGIRTQKWYLLLYIDSKILYAHKLLRTTIMSQGDTNYILPYKTNIEVVTKAQLGLIYSVYVTWRLKTKFDGNNFAVVTLFVLDNLICSGVTQNHELIKLVKPSHIKARTGSQTSVVTIYAHTMSHILKKTILEYFLMIFRKCPRVTQYNEQITEIVLSQS